MKLSDFVEEEIARVKMFESEWRRMNAKNPDLFPLDMNVGDWYDQLLGFDETPFEDPE